MMSYLKRVRHPFASEVHDVKCADRGTREIMHNGLPFPFITEDTLMITQAEIRRGKKIRREVVGAKYDTELQDAESDFSQPIRDYTTANLWGTVWADNTIPRKTRSLLNVALTAAFRCSHEMRVHIRGARNNGATKAEIRAVLMQVMMYCGILPVREAVRCANQVFAEETAGKATKPKTSKRR